MEFLIVLIVTVIAATLFADGIKKNAKAIYIIAGAVCLMGIIIDLMNAAGLKAVGLTAGVESAIDYVNNGMLATALFIIVMYIGALSASDKRVSNLMKIRAELSIVASILLVGHIFSFTRVLIGDLSTMSDFTSPQVLIRIITMICGFIAFFICIPLFVTSFKKIRSKMGPGKWKKLQSAAYIFYLLVYMHIMTVLFMESREVNRLPEMVLYSAIFISYTVLRVKKKSAEKKREQSMKNINRKAI